MTVTVEGWIEVTVTIGGWVTVTVGGWTENLDGMGEEDGMKRGGEAGMELAGFKPILSLLALFVILHQLHTIVVGLGVSLGRTVFFEPMEATQS